MTDRKLSQSGAGSRVKGGGREDSCSRAPMTLNGERAEPVIEKQTKRDTNKAIQG